jgi:putative tricarboxylic transport membrane protein
MKKRFLVCRIVAGMFFSLVLICVSMGRADAWEPTKPIEFIVPAGPGGGADVMARFIVPIISKYNLAPKPVSVVNKPGAAGAEGFIFVKSNSKEPHVIIITLDNLFTTPLATGVSFNWREMTPVTRLALDYFNLWVNAETPYKTAKEYLDDVKKAPGKFLMGGTGSAQEDQIITVMLEHAFGVKFSYVPLKGGGDVAVQLVGKHVNSTVNNPSEAVTHWKSGRLKPLATIDTERIKLPLWDTIPTMKESSGVDMSYLMLRGIFAAPGITKDQQDYYVNLMKKVIETPEWKKYVDDNGLKPAFLTGPAYVKWLEEKENMTKDLMAKGNLLKK